MGKKSVIHIHLFFSSRRPFLIKVQRSAFFMPLVWRAAGTNHPYLLFWLYNGEGLTITNNSLRKWVFVLVQELIMHGEREDKPKQRKEGNPDKERDGGIKPEYLMERLIDERDDEEGKQEKEGKTDKSAR